MEPQGRFVSELARPTYIRVAFFAWALVTGYDTLSSQLELPTIRKLFGMSGTLLPWWGWLLVLQAIIVLALFEYVRRNLPLRHLDNYDLAPGLGELESDIEGLRRSIREIAEDRKAIIHDYQNMSGLEVRFSDMLDGLKESIRAQNKVFEDRHLISEERQKEFREQVLRSNAQLFLALQAIRARETERFYAQIIEAEGDYLQQRVIDSRPFEGSDWADWEGHQLKLDGATHRWLELADGWHPKVREWINEMDPKSLTVLDWGDLDALFQNANQIITYKTEIIRLNNWKRLRNHVASAIHLAAFGGPHADEILQHIPVRWTERRTGEGEDRCQATRRNASAYC